MNKSKIAVFLTALDGGGAERVMINLAHGFANSSFAVDLVLVQAEGPYLSQIPSNVKLIDLAQKRLLLSIWAVVDYLKREHPIALISALDTNAVAIWACKLARVSTKVIVTVHNNLSLESHNATQLKRKLTAKFARWFYPQADCIVAVSQGVAQDLINIGLPPAKITVIYNPIVTSELQQKLQEPLEHPWFLSGQPPVIVGVGRLTKQKDFPTLIKAFAQVRQQTLAKLIILGEGEEYSRLTSLIQELEIEEDVTLTGFVSNPYIYMAKASVLVLSSIWEGFGNVLVEAMVAGTCVVSTDCPSGPAEILDYGRYGKLVEVGDVCAIAKAILETIRDRDKQTKTKQRAYEFSLEQATNEYIKLLDNLDMTD
jgi:glycosyltransferase involved in cell wall biosynthesis